MKEPRISVTLGLHEDDQPVSLTPMRVPASGDRAELHVFWLGGMQVMADFGHLESIAEQLSAHVTREHLRQTGEAMQNWNSPPATTTGEAGMAAGDPIGREAAKYLAVRHDTDEEYMEGYELWRGHQEAHR